MPKYGGFIASTSRCVDDYEDEYDSYKTYTAERKAGLNQLFNADNNYITDPSGGYVKAKASFKKELDSQINAENELDESKFTDAD